MFKFSWKKWMAVGLAAATLCGTLGAGVTAYAVATSLGTPSLSTTGSFEIGNNPSEIQISTTTSAPFSSLSSSEWFMSFNSVSRGSSFPSTCVSNYTICQGITVLVNGVAQSGARTFYSVYQGLTTIWFKTGIDIAANDVVSVRFAANMLNITNSNANVNIYNDGSADLFNYGSGWASFNPIYPLKNVSYDNQGGSSSTSGTFRAYSAFTLPANPTRAGYVFLGWYTASTGGSYLGGGGQSVTVSYTTDITLYGRWQGNSNSITYDSRGGSPVSNGSFFTGSSTTLPAAPTYSGYVFNGWYTAATGGTLAGVAGATYSPSATSATTLYAQWSVAARTVTYDANGGSGSMSAQSSGSAANLTSNAFTRAGYYFDGWDTLANGSGTDYANGASYPFASNVTLYAQWRAIPAVPTAQVDIQVPIGQPIANAPVALVADGLMDQTGYTVTVHSTPQIIDQGTIWSGRLNTTVRIPSNLESGWHRLVIEGTAADGTPWVEETYFKVSASGTLLATTDTKPAELAMTGQDSSIVTSVASLGLAMLLLGIGFFAANVSFSRRLKRSQAK